MSLVIGTAAADDSDPSFETHTLQFEDSTVAVHISNGDIGVEQEEIIEWVRDAAESMIAYYDRYPVRRVNIEVRAAPRGRVNSGTAYGGHRIVMNVGPDTRAVDLDEDWRMAHEMVHLSFPDLDRRHIWMTEGVATYVESIARARTGQASVESVWRWMAIGLPKGLPGEGDRGLDRTHTWGRTYWAGCLYFFLADMKIRQQTGNRRSLDDALRAILEAGGDGDAHWPISRVITTGDEATGTTVMTDLYEEMANQPVTPDLEAWFEQLGVSYRDDEIGFNDEAPLAHLRRAITDSPI